MLEKSSQDPNKVDFRKETANIVLHSIGLVLALAGVILAPAWTIATARNASMAQWVFGSGSFLIAVLLAMYFYQSIVDARGKILHAVEALKKQAERLESETLTPEI